MSQYSNSSGESIETAIKISGVANHSAGVQAEYNYLTQKHGQARVGWTMRGQALMHQGNRAYDRLDIVLSDGTEKSYYFDITEFFGQLEREMQPEHEPNLIARILNTIQRLFRG
jgi:hypothetical protein